MKNLLITTLFLSLTFIGCGQRGAVISGTVKLTDGTPITTGEISFTDGKHSFFGAIKADGTYTVGGEKEEKVPPGAYTIYITGVNKDEIDMAAKTVRKIVIVDPKFCSPDTSDISFGVQTGGPVTHNVEVKGPEKKE